VIAYRNKLLLDDGALGRGIADWVSVAMAMMALALLYVGEGRAAAALILCSTALHLLARVKWHHAVRQMRVEGKEKGVEAAELTKRLSLDSLTGQLNRAAFQERLQALATQDGGVGLVVLFFFDLNRFKEVNDTLGHDVGDLLLIEVSRRASEILDGAIAFARLGGDEFAAIMRWVDDRQAADCAERLVRAISRPFQLRGRAVEVSASVGVVIGDPGVHGGEELLRRADLAMYEVKGRADGAYHIFDDMLSNRQLRETSIRTELGKARFDERLMMHYQPIVDARTGRIHKAEALLRTKSSALDGISPALIVSIAEDSGQIVAITDWTLDTALKTALELDITVAVNLSPLYIRHQNFCDRLVERLIQSGCSPSSLIVEITEGVLISDIAGARESIDQLRAIGIEVYLDDFGTGYSSLSYLQNFELDGIKLDRSFIQALGSNDKTARIVRSMIDFSHSVDMKVVIEGVESEWQSRMLQLQGCDFMQGYHFGAPMSSAELRRLLASAHGADSEAKAPALSSAVGR
jgi:diguanylate cyclase (GGDEF)-like protein